MVISCSTTYFLEVGVYISSKVATKGFFEVKNIESSTFLRLLIKKEEFNRSILCFSDTFEMLMPSSKLSTSVSLKVATCGPLRGIKTSKVNIIGAIIIKRRIATNEVYVF